MPTTAQVIGQTLRLLRVQAQVSQKDLAQALGITAQYLSLIEHGHREPSLAYLRRFQAYLKIPLGVYLWLALGNDPLT